MLSISQRLIALFSNLYYDRLIVLRALYPYNYRNSVGHLLILLYSNVMYVYDEMACVFDWYIPITFCAYDVHKKTYQLFLTILCVVQYLDVS